MADRPTYRPRRAFDADETTDRPDTTGQADDAAGAERPRASDRLSGRFTEDEARPIFREAAADADAATVRTPTSAAGPAARTGATAAAPSDAPGAETAEPAESAEPAETAETVDAEGAATRTRRLNFAPRARSVDDEEATTLLPRTTAAGAAAPAEAYVGRRGDDDPDLVDERPRRLGQRTRLALLVGGVAAVVVVGLAIMYTVIGVRAQPGGSASSASAPASSAAGTPTPAALLGDSSMLTPENARPIDPKRTWTVATTVRGPVPDGSGPGCLGSNAVEGAPTAQQTITRTLTSSGSNAPTALHVAYAYASPEDATQAFSVTSRALGSCTVTGDWLAAGRAVSGVGDQATAVAVRSAAGSGTTQHWVVLSRTGRVVDVVDAATPGKSALNVNSVVASLAKAVGAQCGPAGGTCPTTPGSKDAPPPVGGDEPGFLATGDLPPVGSTNAPWVGTPVEAPTADFTGSQCETVDWSLTPATDKSSRVYLLQDVPGIFGLNEIVVTTKDASTASQLVDKIKSDWSSCKERKLTASVGSPAKVTGVAGDGSAVNGYTTLVEQQAGSATTRFRVGIASSGDKVAFVFLNPQKGLDINAGDWNVIAVRAVQRATQQG